MYSEIQIGIPLVSIILGDFYYRLVYVTENIFHGKCVLWRYTDVIYQTACTQLSYIFMISGYWESAFSG